MKIVIDDKIPYISETLALLADDVRYVRGAAISAADVSDADALIVRTRTHVDERLLGGSSVQFVATATIGIDHLDTTYLDRAGIDWMSCPGCNAASVAQYVECSLLQLQRHGRLQLSGSTLGIVGCGHVGSRVAAVGRRLGMRVLACDPLAPQPGFVTHEVIEREADVVTFHVPLTTEGRYATHHMADAAFFSRLVRRPVVINTSRGSVVDGAALLDALVAGRISDAVVDVWEGEPDIDRTLLKRVFIGTPHIAGYSADGKCNADNMVVGALCRHFGLPQPPLIVPPQLPADIERSDDPLALYDPMADSRRLKQQPADFERLRNDYPLRREHF